MIKRLQYALYALLALLLSASLAVAQNQVFTGTVSVGGVLQTSQYVTNTTTTTFAAGQLTGAAITVYDSTATTPGSIATRTATQMFGDIPGASVGANYLLIVRNSSSGANTMTITAGTGVTLTGTMTVAQNVSRVFVVTLTSATAITIQSIGTFAAGL